MADPPFGCPPGRVIAVHLPTPPSTNRLWRRKKGGGMRTSDEYLRWKREAGDLLMTLHQLRGVQRIDGPFEAEIVIRHARGDLDNRVKVLLDAAQKFGLIANDANCMDLRVRYGDAPHGCRLILREINGDGHGEGD